MNSLTDLKSFFESNTIPIKRFNGWELVVGEDIWGISHDVFYCNETPVPKKEILKFAKQSIQKEKENVKNSDTKARKWRGMRSRNYRGDGNDSDV